jgi:hypothetical protein
MELKDIVSSYITTHREPAQRELQFYAIQRSLKETICEAAMCRLPSGKRHPHQRRIAKRVRVAAERRLRTLLTTSTRESLSLGASEMNIELLLRNRLEVDAL